MFFKSWTRRSDASIEEQKRREEEEDAARLERLRRAAEAQSLNEEVTKRLKRYSHDESPSSTPPKIDRRHSGLSSKEVNKINKHISRREEERRQPSQRVTPRRDLVQRDEEDEDVEPAETTSGGGSGNASDDETAVVLTPPTGLTPDKQRSAGGSRRASKENMTSAEASASSKGETPERQRRNRLLSSSRERLAELRREAEQKKQDAGLVKAKDEEAEERKKQTARAVGAARASAKLAGGVFYTYQENGEILGKMKEYRNERDALQIEVNQLRQEKEALQVRRVAPSLASYHWHPRCLLFSPRMLPLPFSLSFRRSTQRSRPTSRRSPPHTRSVRRALPLYAAAAPSTARRPERGFRRRSSASQPPRTAGSRAS